MRRIGGAHHGHGANQQVVLDVVVLQRRRLRMLLLLLRTAGRATRFVVEQPQHLLGGDWALASVGERVGRAEVGSARRLRVVALLHDGVGRARGRVVQPRAAAAGPPAPARAHHVLCLVAAGEVRRADALGAVDDTAPAASTSPAAAAAHPAPSAAAAAQPPHPAAVAHFGQLAEFVLVTHPAPTRDHLERKRPSQHHSAMRTTVININTPVYVNLLYNEGFS